jgi:hypothetical protein
VASAKRETLLRAHRFRLRREDLEDALAQATLELMQRARRGEAFAGREHILNALEQRFVSRIHDRRRALAGRSPMAAALEGAARFGTAGEQRFDVADRRAGVEELVLLRQELRRVQTLAPLLTLDQRLVLAAQLAQIPPSVFCRRLGWSAEKYRKVAQRGRARLRSLMLAEEGDAVAAVDRRRRRRASGAPGPERASADAPDRPAPAGSSEAEAGTCS